MNDTESANEFMEKCDTNTLGDFYLIKIYHLDKESKEDDENAIAELNKEIVDLLLHYTNNKRKIFIYSDSEEIIIDNASMSKMATMEMAYTIATSIQQHLNFKAPNANLGVAIGLTTSQFYENNFDDALVQATSMVDAILSNLTTTKIALFDPQFYKRHKQKLLQIEQVKNIITNNTIRIYFTPTIDIKKQQQSFYFLTPIPYGTELKTFYDVLKVSCDIKNGAQRLLTSIFDKIQIISGSKNVELFIKIPYSLAKVFLNTIKMKLDSYIKWIVCFDESDLITYIDDLQSMKETLDIFNSKGIKLAKDISTISSSLPGKINMRFSYFLISKKFTHGNNDEPNINDLRVIQAEYSSFPGRFVYNYLKDFDDLEICAHYSGEIFQCDEIGQPSSRLELINEEEMANVYQILK